MKEKVSNLPISKDCTCANCPKSYEDGRQYGLFQAEEIVKSHIQSTYPINCKAICNEISHTINIAHSGGKDE